MGRGRLEWEPIYVLAVVRKTKTASVRRGRVQSTATLDLFKSENRRKESIGKGDKHKDLHSKE